MSRKDYIRIAAAIQAARSDFVHQPTPAETAAVNTVADKIAAALAADNSRFDCSRFLTACGVQS